MGTDDHMIVSDLERSEENCIPVRKGEMDRIEELSAPIQEREGGLFSRLMNRGRERIKVDDLLASSESLIIKGSYRLSGAPLQQLVGEKGISKDLKEVALARAAQTAVLHDLPLDLGPILFELGLTRKDLRSAIKSLREERRRKCEIPSMEKHLLQSMLLDERADHTESGTMGADLVKNALDGFNMSLSIASDLEGEIGTYHQTRCMYHLASFLLKRGDISRGTEVLDISLKKAEENGFEPLKTDIQKLAGFYNEDLQEIGSILDDAMDSARSFGNNMELAEIMFIKGNRTASESEDRGVIDSGLSLMVDAAEMIEDMDERSKGAAMRTEAALWFARTGSPDQGVGHARKASIVFKQQKDRGSMIRALSVLFLCYMKLDERRRAKKLLLDLAANHPVKQFPASFGILKEAVSGVHWLREDKDTKELFEDEIVYTIERDAVDEVIRRAKESYPNEFGAMLRGLPHITHIEPVMEGAGNRNSFLFSLYSRFSQRNVPGEGVVHSHPSGSARPSRADLSMFGRFPGINIIIGYPYRDDSMAAYDRLGNRVRLEIVNSSKGRRK